MSPVFCQHGSAVTAAVRTKCYRPLTTVFDHPRWTTHTHTGHAAYRHYPLTLKSFSNNVLDTVGNCRYGERFDHPLCREAQNTNEELYEIGNPKYVYYIFGNKSFLLNLKTTFIIGSDYSTAPLTRLLTCHMLTKLYNIRKMFVQIIKNT